MTAASLRVHDNEGVSITLVRDEDDKQTTVVVTFHNYDIGGVTRQTILVSGTVRAEEDGLDPQRLWVKHVTDGTHTGHLFSERDEHLPWVSDVRENVLFTVRALASQYRTAANDERLFAEIEKVKERKAKEQRAARVSVLPNGRLHHIDDEQTLVNLRGVIDRALMARKTPDSLRYDPSQPAHTRRMI